MAMVLMVLGRVLVPSQDADIYHKIGSKSLSLLTGEANKNVAKFVIQFWLYQDVRMLEYHEPEIRLYSAAPLVQRFVPPPVSVLSQLHDETTCHL